MVLGRRLKNFFIIWEYDGGFLGQGTARCRRLYRKNSGLLTGVRSWIFMKMLHVGQPSRRGPCFSPRETHVFQAIFVRPCIGGAISHQPFIVHKLDEVSYSELSCSTQWLGYLELSHHVDFPQLPTRRVESQHIWRQRNTASYPHFEACWQSDSATTRTSAWSRQRNTACRHVAQQLCMLSSTDQEPSVCSYLHLHLRSRCCRAYSFRFEGTLAGLVARLDEQRGSLCIDRAELVRHHWGLNY